MRLQRRAPVTVQLVRVSVTKDQLGTGQETRQETVVSGAVFEPERILERPGQDQAPVVQPAAFNVPGAHTLDADDLLVEGSIDAQGAFVAERTWQVVGGSTIWLDRTNVPVTAARAT